MKTIIFIAIFLASFARKADAQTSSIEGRDLKGGNMKIIGDVEYIANGLVNPHIKNGDITIDGKLTFNTATVTLENVTIACADLVFGANVTTVIISGDVKIKCSEDIEITSGEIYFNTNGAKNCKLFLGYSGALAKNKNIKIAGWAFTQVQFVKQ